MRETTKAKVRFRRTEVFYFEFDEAADPDLFVNGKLDKKKVTQCLIEDNIYGEDLYSMCVDYSRNRFTFDIEE